MRQTRAGHSCTCLIENLGKYPFAKEIGLIFAACRVIRDVEPHLQNIADRFVMLNGPVIETHLLGKETIGAVAAWLIAKRKVNTLVMVHRQQLLDQWHERLAMF